MRTSSSSAERTGPSGPSPGGGAAAAPPTNAREKTRATIHTVTIKGESRRLDTVHLLEAGPPMNRPSMNSTMLGGNFILLPPPGALLLPRDIIHRRAVLSPTAVNHSARKL